MERLRGSGTYVTKNALNILKVNGDQSLQRKPNDLIRAVHVLVKEYSDVNMSLNDEVNLFVTKDILMGVNDALISLRIPYYQQCIRGDGTGEIDFSNIGPQDGVIMFHGRTPKNLKALKERNIPFTVVNYPANFVCEAGVEADDAFGVHEAVEYLAGLGCKNIAYLGPVTDMRYIPRLSGFMQGVVSYDLESSKINCEAIDEKGIQNAICGFLDTNPMPDAIIAATDHRALLCMKLLQERGVNIPDDVKIIGFDDSPSAATATPALASIRKPRYEMGREAALILLDIFRSSETKVVKKVLKTSLIVRESAMSRKN